MTLSAARSFTALYLWNRRGDFQGSTEVGFVRLKMAKTMTLAAFLVCISCALAADSSSAMVAPTSTLPSQTSHQPLASSSAAASPSPSPAMTSSAVPVPSPTPDRPIIPDNNYVYPKNGPVCIHLEAEIETTVTYETANGPNTTVLVVSGNASVSDQSSMCNDTYAKLVLTWNNNMTNLIFAFSADNSSWREEGVTFEYALTNGSLFPGYQDGSNHSLGIAMFGNLLKGRDSNSNNQSFLCNATQTFNSHDTENITNATLIVRDLRMQAFHFTNSTGEFDSAYDCAIDQSTNKIVPIVVGAALAGLVIVVLIAYLIGRFRNRKQSSYEALS